MSSGTELATFGRLFTGVVQAVKGRGWFGTTGTPPTPTTRPDQVSIQVITRTGTLLETQRTASFSITQRTVSFEVTP